jgi:hypothetical protein
MVKLLRDDARRLAPARNPRPIHRARHCSGNNEALSAAIFGISPMPEPIAAASVCYRGTGPEDKIKISIRFSSNFVPERFP